MPSTIQPPALDEQEPAEQELTGNDIDLVEQILAGNTAAFAQLMGKYSKAVGYIVGEFRDADKKDVEQRIWVNVWQSLPEFDESISSFDQWLRTKAQEHAGSVKSERKEDPLENAEQLTDEIPETTNSEHLTRLKVGLEKLSVAEQELATLFIEMDSVGDIAEHTHESEDVIKEKLARIQKRLRRFLI